MAAPVLVLLFVLILGYATSSCLVPQAPFDVLLISLDTLRADHLPLFGYERATSPHLEELAKDSVFYERAYAQAPFTLISHMSMFTALLPSAHGVEEEVSLPEGIPTFTETLHTAGYTTYGLYTITWMDPKFGFAKGFDSYEMKGRGDSVIDAGMRFYQRRADDDDDPSFLFLHFRDIHCGPNLTPPGKPLYDSPPEFRDHFLPDPAVQIDYAPREIWEGEVELDEAQLEKVIAQYDGGIYYVDALLGRLFRFMKETGRYDDTMIIVMSDHGESLGDRGRMNAHGGFWEEGLKVPLLVKLPARHKLASSLAGTTISRPVQLVDLGPTILAAVGLPAMDNVQGADLFTAGDRPVIAHRRNISVLIRDHLKLRLLHGDSWRASLYDLQSDPGEQRPLDQPELAEAMARELNRSLRTQREYLEEVAGGRGGDVELAPKAKQQLEALGYVE